MKTTNELIKEHKKKIRGIYKPFDMYLCYRNDFLTIERCAEYLCITPSSMKRIINHYKARNY